MNKTILILGAGSDVGMAVAKQYAANGFDTILAGRNVELLHAAGNDLNIRYNTNNVATFFDALDFGSHTGFVNSINKTLNTVLCVFGYLGDEELARTDFNEAEKIIHTNYTASVSILNAIAQKLLLQQNGTIIGISSVAGDRGRQSNYHYGSAKAGFTTYLSGLRNYLQSKGVHVMTVKPGFMQTKMTSHLNLPPLLTSIPTDVAKRIYSSAVAGRNTIYVSSIWFWIMLVIKMVPEVIFKKMKM